MKGILWFFAVMGALAIIALAILVGQQFLHHAGNDNPATMEQAPVLTQQTLDAIQAKAAKIGKHLTWAVFCSWRPLKSILTFPFTMGCWERCCHLSSSPSFRIQV